MSDSARFRSPVAPGDVIAGKYRVERVLGAGGMGVVVAATHLDLDQAVALKFILPQAVAGKGNVERFMREARAAVRLKSEHVARVYDVGRDDQDRPFMVLELLEGMDLAKLIKSRGSLPVADAVEYVLQACEALVEAHQHGIVHRDLKPQNLFVTRRLNGTPLLKVLDFGIAKAIGPAAAGQMALTDSSAIIGSPLYMAPEQMRSSRDVDLRSDVWALGVILYEVLGGQLPFFGETVTEVCIRVVNEEPDRLLALRPALDASLVDIVMRCLEKDPEDRWQTVAQLASALEPYSRSARQGGLVRPWRSFEDTYDSHEIVGDRRPQRAPSPDETGPSTALTMPSEPAPELAAAIASRPPMASRPPIASHPPMASRPPMASHPPMASRPPMASNAGRTDAPSDLLVRGPTGNSHERARDQPSDGAPLVSTDVAWGAGTGTSRRTRSVGTWVAVGGVLAVATAAAMAGLFIGRGTAVRATAEGGALASSPLPLPAGDRVGASAEARDAGVATSPTGNLADAVPVGALPAAGTTGDAPAPVTLAGAGAGASRASKNGRAAAPVVANGANGAGAVNGPSATNGASVAGGAAKPADAKAQGGAPSGAGAPTGPGGAGGAGGAGEVAPNGAPILR